MAGFTLCFDENKPINAVVKIESKDISEVIIKVSVSSEDKVYINYKYADGSTPKQFEAPDSKRWYAKLKYILEKEAQLNGSSKQTLLGACSVILSQADSKLFKPFCVNTESGIQRNKSGALSQTWSPDPEIFSSQDTEPLEATPPLEEDTNESKSTPHKAAPNSTGAMEGTRSKSFPFFSPDSQVPSSKSKSVGQINFRSDNSAQPKVTQRMNYFM